ncbi:MFS transporter [Thermoproteota archaeon]
MATRTELKSNIWKYNAFNFMRNFIFSIPIIAIFFLENGLDLRQIMIIEAVFAVTVVMFEIPSGYFADRHGRKLSMVIGSAALFIASLIFLFSADFIGFMIGEIVWGIGASFASGADSALIYDTLAQLKQKKQYKKVEGHAQFIARISEGTASLAGGVMAIISTRITFLATAIAFFFMIFLCISLKEPKTKAVIVREGHVKNMYKILRFALHRNKVVKWLIVYSAIIALFGVVAFWFSQPYFKLVGLPIVYFGALFAVAGVVTGLASKYAHIYEKKIGLKAAIISLPIIAMISLFFIGKFVFLFSIIFFLGVEFVRGIEFPLVRDLMNKIVWPQNRATILSVSNLIGRLLFVIFAPLFGWFADLYTIPTAFYLLSGSMFIFGAITLSMMHYHKAV